MTVGGEICQHEFRGNMVVCPLPPSLQFGKDGVPLQVGDTAGLFRKAQAGGSAVWA